MERVCSWVEDLWDGHLNPAKDGKRKNSPACCAERSARECVERVNFGNFLRLPGTNRIASLSWTGVFEYVPASSFRAPNSLCLRPYKKQNLHRFSAFLETDETLTLGMDSGKLLR